MTSRTWTRKALAFSLALVLFNAAAVVVWAGGAVRELQEPGQIPVTGQLTLTGKVTVNGQPAATGDTVTSGSTIEAAAHSSAVVSLGKLGRVEALPETRMKLSYDDSSISISLGSGRVRVSTGPGVAATITTKND
jgi:nitrous oxidase accessory protein NosD